MSNDRIVPALSALHEDDMSQPIASATRPSSRRLHRFPLSGHSHRAELMLSLLGLETELVTVDLGKGEHKLPAFLAKNPFGQVPVLEDGSFTISDSNAILVYLAERYDLERRYWPLEPERRAQIQRWLSVASGPLAAGPAAARLVRVFQAPLDQALAIHKAHELFTLLEDELQARDYFVGAAPTLADVALYSYVAHAPEGDVSLSPYPRLRAWITRIEALPGFVAMPRSPSQS